MALFNSPKEKKKPARRKAIRSNKYNVAREVHAARETSKRIIPVAANSAFIKEWANKMRANENAFVLE